MPLSLIAYTDGSGKNLETFQRTRSAVAYENQIVIPGEPAQPTFEIICTAISTATSASHLVMIQADGTLYTRIKRIYVEQVGAAGSATLAQLQIVRVSTAGSGGSAITARGRDSADSYSGTIQTLPSSKGTEGNILLNKRLALSNTAATTANPNNWEWKAETQTGQKGITIGSATTDGVVLKIITGIASATVDISITFTTDTAL
jgi:hypothetical protein